MSATDPPTPTERDYRRLREATRTYREDLVVRLAGEVGLRPAEMTRVALADVSEREIDGRRHHFLAVEGTQGDRRAYLPRDVHADLRRFANERALAESEPVLSVSARRVQMLVAEVADRVADVEASTRGLRRRFARRLLRDRNANPRVVREVGGWSSLDTLASLYPVPDDEAIVAAFADAGREPTRRGLPERDGRFEAMVAAAQAVGRAVGRAGTRDEVEAAACETVRDRGPFDAAWVVGAGDHDASPTPHAWAGIADEAIDAVGSRTDELVGWDEGGRDGEPVVVDRRALPGVEGPGRRLVALVAVGHGETVYGTMGLVATDDRRVDERERRVLADMGRRVGQAVAAVSHRRLLQADAVVELDFRADAPDSCLVAVAEECDCSLGLVGVVPATDGALVLYVRVTGSAPESVVDGAAATDRIARARLVRSGGESAIVELNVTGESLAATLTEYGGNLSTYDVADGTATVTAQFPTDVDVRTVVNGVTAAFPETEFVARRETSHPASSPGAVSDRYVADLTERQRSVLRAAYLAGYFDWPRGTTAEELADALGISSPTLHNHLRKAQRSLLDDLFEDAAAP
ncbi:MAG: bacterio-opsin activator domain-containing protein [Halanaeroarchaeum sp.]